MDPHALADSAARLVAARYPMAVAAVLGGSAAAGTATPRSDLDVVVVLPSGLDDIAFVETLRHEGRLAEVFCYGQAALPEWLARGREARRPVLDRLLADGIGLLGTDLETALAAASRTVLGAGPKPFSPTESEARRYVLSALLDDLADTDESERFAIATTLWRETAELALLAGGHWLGTGKWLVRELHSAGLDDLAGWAGGSDIESQAREVLDAAGGYLQDGMVRGTRPAALVPAGVVVAPRPDTRSDGPLLGSERQVLDHWLDLYRESLLLKVSGLAPEQLCARGVPPSSMSLLGIVRHLTEVEAYWLREVLDGQEVPDICSTRGAPDADWLDTAPQTATTDLDRYVATVEQCRGIAARYDLDAVAARERRGQPLNHRWILTHLVEEYARHLGHADLLREVLDGRTGY